MPADATPDERSTGAYTALPDALTTTWVSELSDSLEQATWRGQAALKELLPSHLVTTILEKATAVTKLEPALVEVNPVDGASVTVVGDTHGQLHDVLNLLRRAGAPSATNYYIFNGDFVDRGAWGLEVLLVLSAWKLAFPTSVTLLRGNHETATCTTMYGFKGELQQKFLRAEVKNVYNACKKLFASLPLAAVVSSATLVLHGGLFRKPSKRAPAAKSRRKRNFPVSMSGPCELGALEDLRSASKGGADPNGRGQTALATDVLWSDPVATPGLEPNVCRGVGTTFGPDVTQKFLEENGLKLILRSHEGPDARFEREDMASMQEGWTTDHVVEAGRLMTVFSAPDYPQFQSDESARYGNLAAVARLSGPDWSSPSMMQFAAVLPRPDAIACYDYADVPGSDEEIEIAGSEASGASSIASDLQDTAAQLHTPASHVAAAAVESENALPQLLPDVTAAGRPSIDPVDASFGGRTALPAECKEGESSGGAAVDGRDGVSTGAALAGAEDLASNGTNPAGSLMTNGVHDPVRQEATQNGEVPTPSREAGSFEEDSARPMEIGDVSAAQHVNFPGRELEQAAAIILAVTGGVPQDSPIPASAAAEEEKHRALSPSKRPLDSSSDGFPTKRAAISWKAQPAAALSRPPRQGQRKAPWR